MFQQLKETKKENRIKLREYRCRFHTFFDKDNLRRKRFDVKIQMY